LEGSPVSNDGLHIRLEHQPPIVRDDPDVCLDERIPHDAYRPTFVKSLVMTPLGKEEPIGAIGCYWSVRYWASDEEITTLAELANMTATALERILTPTSVQEIIRLRQGRSAQSSDQPAIVN
jgi:hypothetical protein